MDSPPYGMPVKIVRHVKRGSDMVAQVPVIGLTAQLMSTQRFVVLLGKRLGEGCIKQREETSGVPGQLLERIADKETIQDLARIKLRTLSQSAQRDNTLDGIVQHRQI